VASNYPQYPSETQGGDDPTFSPQKGQNTLLGSERGTQHAKRLETDASNNLYVRVAADDTGAGLSVTPLATGSATSVPASTLTTIVTYTAVTAKKVSKISCGGSIYAKFQLFINTVLVDTHRSGPDRAIQLVFDSPLSLGAGDVLDVKVTHYVTGELEEFEATVYGG
jgi:hypothetical protein